MMGQNDLSKGMLIESKGEPIGPGVTGVVIDPEVSPNFAVKDFLSFWEAKRIAKKEKIHFYSLFFGIIYFSTYSDYLRYFGKYDSWNVNFIID